MRVMVLVSLLVSPGAQAVSWRDALRREEPRAELGWSAGLKRMWHQLQRLWMADEDNRPSLDPNG